MWSEQRNDERSPADRSPSSAKPSDLCDECCRSRDAHDVPNVDHQFAGRPHRPADPSAVQTHLAAARAALAAGRDGYRTNDNSQNRREAS